MFILPLTGPQQSQVDAGDEEQEEDNEMDEDEMGGMEASESTFDFNGFINEWVTPLTWTCLYFVRVYLVWDMDWVPMLCSFSLNSCLLS